MNEEERMRKITVSIWRVFAAVVAVALVVNAVQAVTGKAEFAWWHLPTLGIAYAMGACGDWLRRLPTGARLMKMRWRVYSVRKAIRTHGC